MRPVCDYSPYINKTPSILWDFGNKARTLPAIAPPEGDWEILNEPVNDPDYQGLIFIEIGEDLADLKSGRNFNKLKRDFNFLKEKSLRKIVVELPDKEISENIIRLLQELNKTLSQEKVNPYKREPEMTTGKLSIFYPSDSINVTKLQNRGLHVFNSWDDAADFASGKLEVNLNTTTVSENPETTYSGKEIPVHLAA